MKKNYSQSRSNTKLSKPIQNNNIYLLAIHILYTHTHDIIYMYGVFCRPNVVIADKQLSWVQNIVVVDRYRAVGIYYII